MKLRILAALALLIGGLAAPAAEAGVAGARWSGSFTNSDGETATSCLSFGRDDTCTLQQDFGRGAVVFEGTYTEVDLFLFSFWDATYADGSPDRQFTVFGISLLSFFSTFSLTNGDLGLTASGFYVRGACPESTSRAAPAAGGRSLRHQSTVPF